MQVNMHGACVLTQEYEHEFDGKLKKNSTPYYLCKWTVQRKSSKIGATLTKESLCHLYVSKEIILLPSGC